MAAVGLIKLLIGNGPLYRGESFWDLVSQVEFESTGLSALKELPGLLPNLLTAVTVLLHLMDSYLYFLCGERWRLMETDGAEAVTQCRVVSGI